MADLMPSLAEMKVLIVDDTTANIDVLRKTLEPQGFHLSIAPNGEVALKIVDKVLPDLILLDVMMPGIDGFEVCRRLRQVPRFQEIPVIFITAKTEVSDLVQGFEAGGQDYITKPFRQEEVLIRVEHQLRLRKLLKEKEGMIRDLTDLKEQLEKSACTDTLTQLFNRRGIKEHLDREIFRFERNKTGFSVILSDIDFFKKVNDRYGHDGGDQALIFTSHLLNQSCRKQDVVCRWGGEEFLILLPETRLEGAVQWAEKVRGKFNSEQFVFEGKEIPLTMSFGVAEFGRNGNDLDECLRVADACLYKAKESGRNRVISAGEI